MATIKKLTPAELASARRAGYKRKKPKKPRASATLNALEAFVARYNEWVDGARAKIKEKAAKDSAVKKRITLQKSIRTL